MRKFLRYLNPLNKLGDTNYSLGLPFFTTLSFMIVLEGYAYLIAHNPEIVGMFAIVVFLALIIYFAFRDGIRGGIITAVLTIMYYFYIIYSRHYTGQRFISAIETTLILGILYLFIAGVIGWLKQTIDQLIEKEADEKKRLQAIVQQLPAGVLITDSKGQLILTNKQLDQILGTKIPAGFIFEKEGLNTLLHDKQLLPAQSTLFKAITSKRLIVGKEYDFQRQDGKRLYVQVSSTPIHNRHGKTLAVASVITDMTTQKEMEERKDDFVNMASHELKTPITSMKLYIDSLLMRIKQYNDERATKTLTSIKYQTERLQELVSDLLDVSRLQTGKLMFRKEVFHIEDLLTETIEQLEGATNNHTILFTAKTKTKVYADKFRLYQVITNLLTNAIKYSPIESIITITVKKVGKNIQVSITDQGIGISKEQQKKIFARLYQVTDSTEKTFPGLGMGLYISKEIIKRHKGIIGVNSVKGKGSTFFFALPMYQHKK